MEFMDEVLGYDRLAPKPHIESLEFIQGAVEPLFYPRRPIEQTKTMFGAPRGTFKSTIDIGLILWIVPQLPNIRILLDAHSNKFTRELLYAIKWHMAFNDTYKEIFGDMSKDALRWHEDSIIVNKRSVALPQPTVQTAGVDAPKTGGHYDLIIVDDLINEKSLTRSGLLKSRRHVGTLVPILEPNGCELFTFTRWDYRDCYGKMLDDEQKVVKAGGREIYRKKIEGVYRSDGSLYAPTILPESAIAQLRLELTDKEFANWYLNVPQEEASKIFPQTVLQFYRGTYHFDAVPFIEVEVA
jgi:hypothetical protein